jgi:aspartate/methionine/tyrosine aminotransferase
MFTNILRWVINRYKQSRQTNQPKTEPNGSRKMSPEQAEKIEREHNVHVDAEAEMYTTGSRDLAYGWVPVPVEWTEETE